MKYQIRNELYLEVRGQDAVATPPPFEVVESQEGMILRIQSSDRLRIEKSGVVIHNGLECIFPVPTQIEFKGKVHDLFRISDVSKNYWKVQFKFNPGSLGRWNGEETKRLGRPFFKSVLTHGVVVASILLLFKLQALWIHAVVLPESTSLQTFAVESVQLNSEKPSPFSGMSLAAFEASLQATLEKAVPAVQASRVLSRTASLLGKLFTPIGSPQVKPTQDSRIDTRQLVSDALLEKTASAKTASSPAVKSTPRELSLRQKLDILKPKFSEVFDKALRIDPSLSVTVSYQGVINAQGKLEKVRLQTQGKSTPVALQALENGVRWVLEISVLGKEFSGTALRGEQAFIK